jgi:hypothetical protein
MKDEGTHMRRTTLRLSVLVLTLGWLFLASQGARAQESGQESKSKVEESQKPTTPYRLDFAVYELEDGKRINTRQYSMNLNADDSNEIKIGTRVPVANGPTTFQYLDVGTKIWCRLMERSNGLYLSVRSDISNFAPATQQGGQPIIRQIQINASTVVQPGKPLIVGSVDDTNSKRQFQLEVTVNKLR